MNDRLLNNPVPPREIDPVDFSRSCRKSSTAPWSAIPRTATPLPREFAWDLEHLDQVGVAERPELHDWRRRRTPVLRRILFYAMLAMLPVVIFTLLIWAARRG